MENILSKFCIPDHRHIAFVDNEGMVRNINNNESVRDIDNKYILKRTLHLDQCKKNINLTQQLSKNGILVPQFIPLKDGGFYIQDGDYFYSLMTKINGKPMDIGKGDYIKNAENMGKIVASLTLALSSCECSFCKDMDWVVALNDWIPYEIKSNALPISREILDYLSNFEALYKKLPRQINHKDLNGGNILFDDNRVFQGFIDFDRAETDARVYDLCYIFWCILWTDRTDTKQFEKCNEIARSIYVKYDSIVMLTDEEKLAIPYFYIYIGLLVSASLAKSGDTDFINLAVKVAENTELAYSNLRYFWFA